MDNEDWDKAGGIICPACGQETVRLVGRLCPQCSKKLPDDLAAKLTKIGLPAKVDYTRVTAALFEHEIELDFSPEQSILYYHPARQAERRLFQGLEADLKRWAQQKGLSFATREGVEGANPISPS